MYVWLAASSFFRFLQWIHGCCCGLWAPSCSQHEELQGTCSLCAAHTHTHTPTHLTNIGLLCIGDKRTARGVKSSSQVNTRAEDHNAAVALLSALSHPSAASSSPAVSCYLLLILIPMTLPVFRPDVCVFPCRRAAAAAVEQVATQRSGRRCGRRGQNKACVSARPAALATGRNHILLLSNTSCKSNYFNKSFNN